MTLHDIAQGFILVCSGLAIWLVAKGETHQRADLKCAGGVIGLAGQPFWFWHAYSSSGWGVFVLTVVFCASYFEIARANWWWLRRFGNTRSTRSTRTEVKR